MNMTPFRTTLINADSVSAGASFLNVIKPPDGFSAAYNRSRPIQFYPFNWFPQPV